MDNEKKNKQWNVRSYSKEVLATYLEQDCMYEAEYLRGRLESCSLQIEMRRLRKKMDNIDERIKQVGKGSTEWLELHREWGKCLKRQFSLLNK